MYRNHFSLIWKSNGTTFNKSIEEVKLNNKIVNNIISDDHVKSFNKDEYKSKKVQAQLTHLIVFDIEFLNTDRIVPYSICICKINKISNKYN